MGAFIGYGHRGVWANNRERDAFLDWYAQHHCQPGDSNWEFCKSEGNRWMGCGIELAELIPLGQRLTISDAEYDEAVREHSPDVADLLRIISKITTGDWRHDIASPEANYWRKQA